MNTYHHLFKEIINDTQHPSSFHFSLRYATPWQAGRRDRSEC